MPFTSISYFLCFLLYFAMILSLGSEIMSDIGQRSSALSFLPLDVVVYLPSYTFVNLVLLLWLTFRL